MSTELFLEVLFQLPLTLSLKCYLLLLYEIPFKNQSTISIQVSFKGKFNDFQTVFKMPQTDAFSELIQTCKIDLFTKIVNKFQPLTIVTRTSILYV